MQVLDEAHLMTILKRVRRHVERIVRIDRVEFLAPGEVELTQADSG